MLAGVYGVWWCLVVLLQMTPSSRQTVRTLAFSVGGGRVGTDGAVITFLVQALVCGKLREERMPQSLVCKDGKTHG